MKTIKTFLFRIAPPVLGGVIGFALLLLLVSYGELIVTDRLQDKVIEQMSLMVGTFVAAWAGGWAAFNAERRTRDNAERKSRISAANKALFVIATMYNVFDNLRQFYIDKGDLRQHPHRALIIDSPQPGMMQILHFDFDALNYFLDTEGDIASMALMELQLLDWHYQLLVNTIELRAKAAEDLHKAIQAKNVGNLELDGVKTIFPIEYRKSAALTDQLIQLVDEGINLTKAMDRKMQIALQQQFSGQSFVQIKFAEKPQNQPSA